MVDELGRVARRLEVGNSAPADDGGLWFRRRGLGDVDDLCGAAGAALLGEEVGEDGLEGWRASPGVEGGTGLFGGG